MKKLNFLMAVHSHQPVDNFGHVFCDAFRKSYEPFLSVLEKHPGVKLSMHYSGSLLEWIAKERPAFIDRLRKLVEKKQIEILTGGYFEPILSMIPEEDRIGQIEMLTETIKNKFNCDPKGIWLAERVWDPELVGVFKKLGIKYTVLDDFHLKQAGKATDETHGYYSIKDSGDLAVFGSLKKLRYTMPFREPNVTIKYLREIYEREEKATITFADDCEKFGFWPRTFDWVYRKGWLDKFFTKLEENDWINTLTFSEAMDKTSPLGELTVPHSSYAEMVEWCDGDFNNFFKKYPESDFMRKRMLDVSKRIEEHKNDLSNPKESQKINNAKTEIYKSQSNCAYWHGVFGGVYMPHLREGVYSHIIKAENAIKEKNTNIEKKENIVSMENEYLNLLVDSDYAGSILEFDYKPISHNLINTISRRPEPYHRKLTERSRISLSAIKKKVDNDESINLYDILGVRERNLKRFLNYDSYKKVSLLCYPMDLGTSFWDFIKSKHNKKSENFLLGRYASKIKKDKDRLTINLERSGNIDVNGATRELRINKCIVLEKKSEIFIKFEIENLSSSQCDFIFGTEFNWLIEDGSFKHNLNKKNLKEIALVDKHTGLKLNHSFEEPVNLWSFPIFTLNESERGLGKNFQGVSLLFNKQIKLCAKEKFSLGATIRISK